jgi:hypothetical protein
VSNVVYYSLWLGAGLIAVAIVSAIISRQFRRHVMRRLKAAQMIDALTRYSEWVAAQRRTLLFQGDIQDDASALHEVRSIGEQWFPELRAEAAHIGDVHERLVEFLLAQQALREQDPEAWLESDHDARFLEQWRRHLLAVQLMIERLTPFTEAGEEGRQPGTTSAA